MLLCLLLVFADLVADDATDHGAADRSGRASARKYCATHGAGSGADRGIFVSRRHIATSTQAEHHRCRKRTDCKSMHRFHGNWYLFFKLPIAQVIVAL